MSHFVLLVLSVFLAGMAGTSDAGNFKVLGGYVEEYSENGRDYLGKSFKWGQSEADSNSEAIEIERMYCSMTIVSSVMPLPASCHHFLVVSTKSDPDEEHYEIVGSNLRIYLMDTLLNSYYENGIIHEYDNIKEYQVAIGKTWCGTMNDFLYGNLYFYVNKTTQPPATDDFSNLLFRQGNPDQHKDEIFLESHAETSARVQYSAFSRYQDPYGKKGYSWNYMWMSPTTLVYGWPFRS